MRTDHSGRTCTHVHRTTLRALLVGALPSLLSLLSLAWPIGALLGQPPATAYASGVPYCGKLAEERTPTRPAIHLNRSEGPIGTNLSVTASNWHPGMRVTLDVDGREPNMLS